jgi:DNA polymerase V
VDCNNFYASCERVFQPAWENRPVGVLSNNDGCLVARSNELKAAGIAMGTPYFQAREQLTALNAVVVSSNYALYGDMSARVMDTLSQFTPEIEIYSIDEAWLDLSGFDPAILDGYAREIARVTRQHTGIPVSIGIGPTKVLAKVANRLCKKRQIPGQVFNLGQAQALEGVLAELPVQDIWGIGRQWSKALNASGIYTAWQLREADPVRMRKRYNVVMERLILELRGIPCLGFEDITPKKQIIASRSFGKRVTSLQPLQEAVAMHVTRAAEKLRAQGSVCRLLQVSIRSGKYNPQESFLGRSTQLQFPVATADTRTMIAAARRGVEQIYVEGVRYVKAGIMLLDLMPADAVQLGLFDRADSDQSQHLMKTIDQVNRLYGKHTLFFAAEGTQKNWSMKRDRLTPAYTTRWDDIPVVK